MLDADKEGFLRATASLVQTCGRAARNVEGRVIFYADKITDSMQTCLDIVQRRRVVQEAYNVEHSITPRTIIKPIRDSIESLYEMDYADVPEVPDGGAARVAEDEASTWSVERLRGEIEQVRADMLLAANELRFEEAAALRDRLKVLEDLELSR